MKGKKIERKSSTSCSKRTQKVTSIHLYHESNACKTASYLVEVERLNARFELLLCSDVKRLVLASRQRPCDILAHYSLHQLQSNNERQGNIGERQRRQRLIFTCTKISHMFCNVSWSPSDLRPRKVRLSKEIVSWRSSIISLTCGTHKTSNDNSRVDYVSLLK